MKVPLHVLLENINSLNYGVLLSCLTHFRRLVQASSLLSCKKQLIPEMVSQLTG